MSLNACPWNNRRESSEVTYSFIATCFAAFTAYAHLEHSLLGNHNGVNIAGKLLLFYLCPSAPLVDLIFLRLLPVLATFLGLKKPETIEYHSSDSSSYVASTTRSCQFLLAQVSGMRASEASNEYVSVPLGSLNHYRYVIGRREDSPSIRNGQALVLGFLTMQCLGAVIKGSRRLARGSGLHSGDPQHQPAVVLADAEILWYALSGISILCCSWITLLQNKQWKLHGPVNTTNHDRVITMNTVTLVLLCSLYSTLGYMDFYYNEPFWHVGFFHFLHPVPYLVGNASPDSSWDIQRRIWVTQMMPSILSSGVPILVATILFRPKNRILITVFWTLGFLSIGMFALSPVLEVLWEQRLLWNKTSNWGKTLWQDPKHFFYHCQMLRELQPRWRWITRALAIVAGVTLTMATWSKLAVVPSTSKKTTKFIWILFLSYSFSTIVLALFAAERNTLASIRGLRDVSTDWPCPELWQDPLFIPSF